MNLYGIFGTNDPAVALASAISYWVWCCRDRKAFKNKSVWEVWEYFQNSVANSAVTARTLEVYVNNLAGRMQSRRLQLNIWNQIIQPEIVILRVHRQDDAGAQFQELEQSRPAFRSWNEILVEDLIPQGITERHILELLRPQAMSPRSITYMIVAYCQARAEEDFQRGVKDEGLTETTSEEVLWVSEISA